MTTDGHRVLYSTMKIYEANPLIAVVLISLVFESTGQNTGMLKATQSQGVKSVKQTVRGLTLTFSSRFYKQYNIFPQKNVRFLTI